MENTFAMPSLLNFPVHSSLTEWSKGLWVKMLFRLLNPQQPIIDRWRERKRKKGGCGLWPDHHRNSATHSHFLVLLNVYMAESI